MLAPALALLALAMLAQATGTGVVAHLALPTRRLVPLVMLVLAAPAAVRLPPRPRAEVARLLEPNGTNLLKLLALRLALRKSAWIRFNSYMSATLHASTRR